MNKTNVDVNGTSTSVPVLSKSQDLALIDFGVLTKLVEHLSKASTLEIVCRMRDNLDVISRNAPTMEQYLTALNEELEFHHTIASIDSENRSREDNTIVREMT